MIPLPPSRPGASALLLTLAYVVVDAGAVAALALGVGALFAVLHAAACIALSIQAWRTQLATSSLASLRMASLLMPFLGPVAPAMALVMLALGTIRRDRPADADAWHEHLFPNLAADPVSDRMNEINRRQASADPLGDVESFYDVLRWGTLAEQEHVLSLVSRSFRPEFAPVLREGLAAPDLGLRAQAAAGLSLLEARTSANLMDLREDLRRADTPAALDQRALDLARALSDAAHSGLFDQARSAEMREEIVALLGPRAAEPALAAMLGRTLLQLGEYDRAVATLQPAVVGGTGTDAAFAWLLEGLFRLGQLDRLQSILAQHRDRVAAIVKQDGPLAPALRFWSVAA